MADARRKASELAEQAGVSVGPPLRIEEHGAVAPPPPRMYAGSTLMAAAPSMPVSPGEQELVVTVSVVYELLPIKKGSGSP